MQKTIFVVDDNDTNLASAEAALEDEYRVITLPSAKRMFAILERIKPDLILLDIEMPEMDGFETLSLLKTEPAYAEIPVIFLTSMTYSETEVRGFEMGVVDFITKPFSAPVLQNRIKTHLDIDEIIRERLNQIHRLQNGIIFVFADLVEKRDEMTRGHVERTSMYVRTLIEAMTANKLYEGEIRITDFDLFTISSRLHDVGKIVVSDKILNKKGTLTIDEFEVVKKHSLEGERIIDKMSDRTDDVEFLQHAKLFSGYHHERWDGKGYPYGLKETQIPIQGRIMAIADVYDALVSERSYKEAFSESASIEVICSESGKHFDPNLVEVFMQVTDRFHEIQKQFPSS